MVLVCFLGTASTIGCDSREGGERKVGRGEWKESALCGVQVASLRPSLWLSFGPHCYPIPNYLCSLVLGEEKDQNHLLSLPSCGNK